MDDPQPWLTLARVPGLHAGRLAGAAENPLAWLADSRTALARQGFSEAAITALHNPDPRGLDRDEAWLAGPGRSLVTWGSADYPPLLAAIPDAPLVLFVAGTTAALSLPQLAIVGSRNPTQLGRETAEQFARHLAGAGLAITSGLALGVDAASHRGALQAGGWTVAVLGWGPDSIYPRENVALAEAVAAHG
ncbi:MAG: processing protein, partial [Pseudomonadota bacterium]|nr:processing protein [Pseudomonadota bacterium]